MAICVLVFFRQMAFLLHAEGGVTILNSAFVVSGSINLTFLLNDLFYLLVVRWGDRLVQKQIKLKDRVRVARKIEKVQ